MHPGHTIAHLHGPKKCHEMSIATFAFECLPMLSPDQTWWSYMQQCKFVDLKLRFQSNYTVVERESKRSKAISLFYT